MSIAGEITRISTNIAAAYAVCSAKGAVMPAYQNSANLADTIDSIPNGTSESYDGQKVCFYDWDGRMLYWYSGEAALALTELPAMPVHEGLTSVSWNRTLEDIKSCLNADHRRIAVGCCFRPSDNKTKIHIRLEDADTFCLRLIQSGANQALIDWGDGTAPQTLDTPAGTANTRTAYDASHTYAPSGYPAEYVISISRAGDGWYGFGASNYSSFSICKGDMDYGRMIQRIHPAADASVSGEAYSAAIGAEIITAPSLDFTSADRGKYTNCRKLKFAFACGNIGDSCFMMCHSLRTVSQSGQLTSVFTNAFKQCFSLQSVELSSCTNIGSGAFERCYKLQSVGSLSSCTGVGDHAFAYCSALSDVGALTSCASVGVYAFYECRNLRRFSLSSQLTTVESHAFYTSGTSEGDLSEVDLTAYTDPNALPVLSVSFSNTFTACNRYREKPKFYVADEAMKTAFSGATNWSDGAAYYEVKDSTA